MIPIRVIRALLLPLNSSTTGRRALQKNAAGATAGGSNTIASFSTGTSNIRSATSDPATGSDNIEHWVENSKDSEGNKIGVISLSNQNNRNALSLDTLTKLHRQLNDFYFNHPSIKVIVLQSSVEGIFSSGHDLREIRRIQQEQEQEELSPDSTTTTISKDNGDNEDDNYKTKKEKFEHLFRVCSETMECIVKGPKPVIAKVNGVATAAGCQLVASCDLAYATSISKFATPGVNIGLFCSTPGVALGRCVASRKHAMEMLFTGEFINAQQAKQIGLINCVIEEDLDEYVHNKASIIASKSQEAINVGKPLFVKQMEMDILSDAYQVASDGMVQGLLTEECKEGIDAFLSKRKPNWGKNTTQNI